MKLIYNYIGCLFFLLISLCGCTPESIEHPSEKGIPLASDIDVDISVDQTINAVTFTMNNKKCMPVWIFDGKTYSTVNGMTKIFPVAGTYNVDIKIANSNGVSDGYITKTFTLDNSIVNFDSYISRLAGDNSKKWRIAKEEAGHIGCGPSGTDGLEWYSASANEKENFGLYDDFMTFDKDMNYTYDPGDGGTVYVNTGCTIFSEYNTNDGADFMAKVSEQKSTYDFTVSGNDIYLVLPKQTLFPYLPNDDAYNTPKYKILNLTSNKMELVFDNGNIAWHYILVSGDEEKKKDSGYDPNSDCNLWKNATIKNEFYYAPNWVQIADPTVTKSDNTYSISLPVATSDTWQAQVKFLTDIPTNSLTNYDFSIKLTSNVDNNVTVKLYKNGDDGSFYFVENIQLKAFDEYTFIKTNMPGIDMDNVNLVLDFGSNKENSIITVKNVVIKEHSCDDGTVIMPDDDNVNWDINSDCNMWKNVKYTNSFFYAPDWVQISNPEFTENGNSYKIELPTATSQQWQAQVFFKTDLTTNALNKYDFCCTLNSNTDLNGVTIKLVLDGDGNDAVFYFTKNVNIKAYEDFTLKMPNMDGIDMDKVDLVFDFGGNPENTEVVVSGIILKEASCNN